MKLSFFYIAHNRSDARAGLHAEATQTYLNRLQPYIQTDALAFPSEAAMLAGVDRLRGRTSPLLVLLDSRGKTYSSEDFASWLRRQQDDGRQNLVFAIGPASGWSSDATEIADLLLSLGPMTLPHELARLMLTEQVYRAFTIMAGHPYHLGH